MLRRWERKVFVHVTDFANSYMTFTVPNGENTARIQLDALCQVTDESGATREAVLITPCKSELMYGQTRLFQDPNYDFAGIWTRDEYLILRTYVQHLADRELECDSGPNRPRFDEVTIDVRHFEKTEQLHTAGDVVDATLANRHIVARTTIADANGMLTMSTEYPVRTMNVMKANRWFQVDTGPIIIPTWAFGEQARGSRFVEGFALAFVCYNVMQGYTELVLREPTPVAEEHAALVWHYDRIVAVEAKHEFWAVC
jgi:hypothetical protein